MHQENVFAKLLWSIVFQMINHIHDKVSLSTLYKRNIKRQNIASIIPREAFIWYCPHSTWYPMHLLWCSSDAIILSFWHVSSEALIIWVTTFSTQVKNIVSHWIGLVPSNYDSSDTLQYRLIFQTTAAAYFLEARASQICQQFSW